MSFTFVDLFAGIGGFHGALGSLGGRCVYASEIDEDAARVYQRNWGLKPSGDITLAANDDVMEVPPHDVLVGGFPCQPFSKSGYQRGMEESRGTLFWNIAKIIEVRKPTIVLLENVRNLAGPRHIHEWDVIIETLRDLGYRVSEKPLIVSPHRIRPELGGQPQVRERVFIAATRIPKGIRVADAPLPDIKTIEQGWDPQNWSLARHLPLEGARKAKQSAKTNLSESEIRWIDAWDDFVVTLRKRLKGGNLPGFPIWADEWCLLSDLQIPAGTPSWKADFLQKNAQFYTAHKKTLDAWLKRWDHLADFPPSRRKLEWQAQDTGSLWQTIMHFRPSGIRAKRATYVPAMVAITQTSIIGAQKRRITVREGARLQGLPDWFDFLDQPEPVSFKQLGNAVNVGAVYNVMRALVLRDLELLSGRPGLVKSILGAPADPSLRLSEHKVFTSSSDSIEEDYPPSHVLRLVREA